MGRKKISVKGYYQIITMMCYTDKELGGRGEGVEVEYPDHFSRLSKTGREESKLILQMSVTYHTH